MFSGCNDSNIEGNPLFYQQWSINQDAEFYYQNNIEDNAGINAQNVMSIYDGFGVKVAVIDDGFDANHPEIKNKIIKTVSVNKYGDISSDVSHTLNSDYHGTAVAGIIASNSNEIGIVGVASNVELILIKMPEYLDDYITIELFKQAVDAGAEVINCSWGTNDVSEAVKEYIDEISTDKRNGKGVMVVFASGNSNANMGNDESAIESVIGVGATDKTALRTNYSSFGKDLDIMAPGGYELGITTIDPIGNNGVSTDDYTRYDEKTLGIDVSFIGTSASAPIMTGVIALALEKDSSLTRIEIQELLKKSTQTVGLNTPYIDDMIVSVSSYPTISGIYGSSEDNKELHIRLTSYTTNKIYGLYEVSSGDNNEWSSEVTDFLPNDTYNIEVVELIDNVQTTWATDSAFVVDDTKSTQTDKTKRRNDFYGYGKIDLDKFIDNI